jgi:hypothetical protein
MAIQKITSGVIQDGAIAAVDIADGSITAAKLAAGAGGQYSDSQSTHIIAYNGLTISSNVTIAANNGGLSVGPISINSGNTVTISANSRWVVL